MVLSSSSVDDAADDGLVVLGVSGARVLKVYDRYSVLAQPVPGVFQSIRLNAFAWTAVEMGKERLLIWKEGWGDANMDSQLTSMHAAVLPILCEIV